MNMLEKREREKKLTLQQNIIWNTVGMSFYLGCQWLITILAVRLSSDFTNSGYLTLSMSVTNIFYAIASYNMRAYQISDVTGKYPDRVYLQIRTVTCGISILLCALYSFAFYRDERWSAILLYMIFRVVEGFIDILQGFDQRAMRMDIIGKSMFMRGALNVLSFSGTIILTDSFQLAVLAMIVVSVLIMVCYDIPWASRFGKLKGKFEGHMVKQLLMECLLMGIASALSTSIVSIPRTWLDYLYGQEQLGIYGALSSPTVLIQVAATYLFNPMLSVYAEYYVQKEKEKFSRLFKQTLLALCGLSILALFAAWILQDYLLPLLLGESIRPYIYMFIPILGCTILNAIVWLLTNLLVVIREFKAYFWGTLLAAGLAVLGGYPIVDYFGMNGVNYILFLINGLQIFIFGIVLIKKCMQNFAAQREN